MATVIRLFRLPVCRNVSYKRLSILKHSNYTSCFTNNYSLLQGKSNVLLESLSRSLTSKLDVKPDNNLTANAIKDNENVDIDKKLFTLDNQVRRLGRLDPESLTEIIELMEKNGSVNEQQSLMLLRACGNLLIKVNVQNRMKLFDNIWSRFLNLGLKPTINHYNTKLRVLLENEQKPSPTQFLSDLQNIGLEPNKMSYQLLIQTYCSVGNLDGANKILQHMQSLNMAINENIFNSLVTGYMKADDEKNVHNILEKMKNEGSNATATTFKNILMIQAEKGNMEGIRQTLILAEKNGLLMLPRHICDIVFELIRNGYSKHVDEMLSFLPNGIGSNHDILNLVFRLICNEYDESAFTLHKRLQQPELSNDGNNSSSSMSLLRAMIISERPVDKVLDVFNRLLCEGTIDKTPHILAFWAMKYSNIQYADNLFEKIKLNEQLKNDTKFSAPLFWPHFERFEKQKDIASVYYLCGLISKYSENNSEAFKNIYSHGIKSLKRLGEKPQDINVRLKENYVKEEISNGCVLLMYLSSGNLTEAINILKSGPITLQMQWMKSNFSVGYRFNKIELNEIINLLSTLKNVKGNWNDFSSDVLNTYLRFKRSEIDDTLIEHCINQFSDNDIKLSSNYKSRIEQALDILKKKDLIQKLDKLWIDKDSGMKIMDSKEFFKMDVKELEKMHTERMKNNQSSKLTEKWLLSKYCANGDVEKANELKIKMDAEEFDYGPELLRQLAYLEIKFNKNVEASLSYLSKLKDKFPQYPAYIGLLLTICKELIEKKSISEAINLLRLYSNQHHSYLIEKKFKFEFADAFEDMLLKCCNESVSCHRELVEIAFKGFVQEGTHSILKQLVLNSITKDDVDTMIDTLQYCAEKYSRTPVFGEVFKKLIAKEDVENLQKTVDVVSKSFGEKETLHHLGFAFIDLNKPIQATKIFQAQGISANRNLLKQHAKRLVFENKTTEMKLLCDCTKNMVNIDRDEMIFEYIRSLSTQQDNNQKLLDAYNIYEEENVLPKNRTLRYLAKVLENRGASVPFSVPEAKSFEVSNIKEANIKLNIEAIDENEKLAVAHLHDEKLSPFITLCKEGVLSSDFIVNSVNGLYKNNKISFIKQIVHELSIDGRFDVLLKLSNSNLFPTRLLNFIENRFALSAALSENFDTILNLIEKDLSNLPKFISTNILCILQDKSPDLLKKTENLISKYYEGGGSRTAIILNQLFNFFVATDNFDRAKKLLEDMPLLQKNIRYLNTVIKARENGREDILLKLKDLLVPFGAAKTAPIFSHLIKFKCDEDDCNKAIEYLKEARKLGIDDEKLWPISLLQLEELCIKKEIHIPWPAGTIKKRQDLNKEKNRFTSPKDVSDLNIHGESVKSFNI